MQKTLADKTIDHITAQLGHFLADTFLLYVKTLNFHWNMVGKNFYTYHILLEKQYRELAESIDEIAERIRALDRLAPGSMAEFLELSCLDESPADLSQEEMVSELCCAHEALVEHCHSLIQYTDTALDPGTSDLLNKQIRFHAHQAWLLKSHL